MKRNIVFPAEWEKQSGVMLTWPHVNTDWSDLDEVVDCFTAIAREIVKREKLLIVCADEKETRARLSDLDTSRIIFREIMSNDSWARDHAGIPVYINGQPVVCDFRFNGWGMKYAACHDNRITRRLYSLHAFAPGVGIAYKQSFVLEGGSIDTDGCGTLLSTWSCLTSDNRNEGYSIPYIEKCLKDSFGIKQIHWVNNGYLEGDDTDSHIDTLARFCSEDTIAYVRCTDPSDEHYKSLAAMEKDLSYLRRDNDEPYHLLPLPMAERMEWEGKRLPATYANFLIINGAVLVPFYNSPLDEEAARVLQTAFPDREVIGIDCRPLIKQGGSLHCVTMQYPQDFL
jgi:agmatine/peptidylarginine deiminase